MKKYDVAAYIWPAYTGEEPRTIPFWPEKYGEWQTVKNSKPKKFVVKQDADVFNKQISDDGEVTEIGE